MAMEKHGITFKFAEAPCLVRGGLIGSAVVRGTVTQAICIEVKDITADIRS